MLISDQILESGCSELQLYKAKVRTLDLYTFEVKSNDRRKRRRC
jgi:hypothetical protein